MVRICKQNTKVLKEKSERTRGIQKKEWLNAITGNLKTSQLTDWKNATENLIL